MQAMLGGSMSLTSGAVPPSSLPPWKAPPGLRRGFFFDQPSKAASADPASFIDTSSYLKKDILSNSVRRRGVWMAERGDSNPRPATTAMNKNTSTPLIIFVFLSRFAQRRHPDISLPYPSKTCISRNGFASKTGGANGAKEGMRVLRPCPL